MSAHDPDHYKVGGIESIDVIRAKLSPEEFRGFCKGNAMKYIHRAGHKGSAVEDAKKAQVYLGWLSDEIAQKPQPDTSKVPDGWSVVRDPRYPIGDGMAFDVFNARGIRVGCCSTPQEAVRFAWEEREESKNGKNDQ